MGLISRFSHAMSAMFGASKDASRIEAWEQGRGQHPAGGNRIVTNPYPPPYQSPSALDRHAGETSEMRLAYLLFYANEPAFQAALDGKVAAIASLDVAVLPDDENNDKDKRAAEFVRQSVANSPGGWSGLIDKILKPAFLNGYSVTEKVIDGVADQHEFLRLRKKWRGLWAPRELASVDTEYLRFQLDDTRRIIGIVNTRRGLEGYTPDRVIIFTNRKLFENPYGRSDGRSAFRACQLIENAYKLWYQAIKNYSAPFIKAKSKSQGKIRDMLESALKEARSGGWIIVGESDEIELLNFAASTSFQAFERKVDKCRQEIYLAVRGSFLPFLEGMQQDGRGDTETHKTASDTLESMLVQGVCEVINQQLVPDLVLPNFGDVGLPTVSLGGTNWAETKTQLEVAGKVVNEFGAPISRAWLLKVSQCEPPRDDGDAISGKPQPAPPPPMPGGGGFPFAEPFNDWVRAKLFEKPNGTPTPSPFQAALSQAGPQFADAKAGKPDTLPIGDIHTDPERFQFKAFDGPDGLTKKRRKNLARYDGRSIVAWKDHEDGNAYVVDGHGTLASAKASGADRIGVVWVPAKTAEQAKEMGRILNGGATAKPVETFSDAEPVTDDAPPPKARIAIAGEDGQAAMHLAKAAMDDGRSVIESITRDALTRKLNGHTGPLFNADETELLAEAIASTTATAELLGRYRIRERLEKKDTVRRFHAFDPGDGGPPRVNPIPPAQALDYFRHLMPSLANFPGFDERHRRNSFTLAVNTGDVILRQIQTAIETAIGEGRNGQHDVQDLLDAAGVSSRNPQYSDLVFRTNATDSFNAGHDDERQAADVIEEFPVWEFLIVDDERTGEDHRPKGGKFYPAKATFNEVRGDRPFNCRCSQRAIDRGEWARLQKAGAVVETKW